MSIDSWKAEFYPTDAIDTRRDEAIQHTLRKWKGTQSELGGYVGGTSAALSITKMIERWQPPSAALGNAIDLSFGDEENEFVPYFHSRSPAGVALRKAWCEHLAREIEREYGLEPNPYILEEH